jgi:predicted helicase
MSALAIGKYLNHLADIRKVSGTNRESAVSEAFKDLLKDYARSRDLVFLNQYELPRQAGDRRIIDGALVYDLRLPFGYWEAKDEEDDLDKEIAAKFRRGYPHDNIIFEDSRSAVLFQNGNEVMRTPVDDLAGLERLLDYFFAYERPEIAQFRKAVAQFQTDLPAVLLALRDMIAKAQSENAAFRKAEAKFLKHAQETINPSVSGDDVREMLIQHILTEEIFAKVFNDDDFHRQNNVAKELYTLENLFFTGALKKNTLKGLEPYYNAIRATAQQITTHREKQTFLKVIYEGFYKVYNKKAADRLGVVYTPQEIVRFMVESADWMCQKHFKKSLIDSGVEILDPATGTGTFICEVLEHFRGQKSKLAHKYKEELHANEVAILPYYVANLNIEATYAAITGQYAEFPNLCFVDTLDNVAGLGVKTGQHVADLFGALSQENVARIKRQNGRKISVVIGNPPYNANQQNENDNNKNRAYAHIDQSIKDSYIKHSTAQKTKAYDMYTRFFRWASDRMHDDGILAFVTNRSFIDSRTMDGFRRCVAQEFSDIYVVDLGGDVRANPKLSGTKNNVFGIQTGVAISFLVKRRAVKGQTHACTIHYVRRPELETADAKLEWLGQAQLSQLELASVRPDDKANWINLTDNDFATLLPIVSKETKAAKSTGQERAIFGLFTLGINTGRDEWSINFDDEACLTRISFVIEHYNLKRNYLPHKLSSKAFDDYLGTEIKWTHELKSLLRKQKIIELRRDAMVDMQYRPFTSKRLYFAPELTKRVFRIPSCQPKGTELNKYVMFPANGSTPRVPFSALATGKIPDLNFFTPDPAHGIIRYRYTAEGERIDNITDWAHKKFIAHYGKYGALPSSSPSPAIAGEIGPAKRGRVRASLNLAEHPPHPPLADARRTFSRLREKESYAPLPSPALQEKGTGRKRELTKDAIFHYVYGVLHDPLYREKYAQNLKREFPRIPFYANFWRWADWGEALMGLHIGYESVEPWPLTRVEAPAQDSPKVVLRSDPANGMITLDSRTQLSGIPIAAWNYRLGNRSALDWILDQHKEKTPKDATIREKFNTYRFSDHKDKVVDLIARVTRVSVETMEIVDMMRGVER